MARRETLIFGCSAMGHEVATQLAERGIDAYLYSSDPDEVGAMLAKGLQAGVVDYTDDDKLCSIGIGKWVKTIFCLFSEEPQNLFVTLSARALDPDLKIICVCESVSSGNKLLTAGATKVIDPYEISGHRVHELIARPYLVEMLENTVFGKHIDIAEIEIPRSSSLSGAPMDDLQLSKRYNLIVMGVVDLELSQELIFSNRGMNHLLDGGDMLVVIGPKDEISRLRADVEEDKLEPGS
ncbi:MAG: NAD-binding protein [Candidatus Thiodiazotropha sp. (ex Semelilucina semeliformis)]|nr:NAD-binding protein [Candidatus Thiodiazotropha sp. (ex Myrtea spinifera)]MCU7806910.1 NAD-binding protein [Candidatus Thiodiazotropha sp. (ex Semelilucina semeliformis)]MCU7827741.1 NAD-binding protein [Candidatus Thiodiazotropha sp. (ex Myrtea sp. 'scaly one' KF741663)]